MTSCYPEVQAPTELSYFTAITLLVFSVIVSSGNLLIILAVLIDPLKKLRSPFMFFLVNLAVSDLIVGIITLPVGYAAHIAEVKGKVPDHLMPTFHISTFISTTASVLSLSALCLDRLVAVRWPIRYRKSLSLKRCGIIAFLIWVFSGALSMLYFTAGFIDHLMIFAHVAVAVTLAILIMTYRQVYMTLRRRKLALRAMQDSANRHKTDDIRNIETEKKVTRAFLYILALFICCFLPSIIIIYILQFCESCNCTFRHVLRDLSVIFVFANSAMNPFVCTIRLKPFRQAIAAIFKCKCKRRNRYESSKSSKDATGSENIEMPAAHGTKNFEG
eukprot:Seg1621.6 transcript_id=Seg1621.6/GoldUCD/mRNA.D3Y31 product="5-hydroxytryptamine receptor 2C" protein_id=Seg1621.6/GoldUCD/D3Y31